MGTGYTRNDSSNNIADGNVINASDLDGEFDAIVTAFSTSGHTHDGTAAEGGAITVMGPVQDFVVSATEIKPKTTNTLDIGTSLLQFKDIYIDGTAYLDTVDIDAGAIDGATIGGSSAAAITGTTITGTSFVSSGDMTFGDNDKAIFGAGSDLQIYHDGSNSYIADTGAGDLLIRSSNDLWLQNAAGTETYARFDEGASTYISYAGSTKLTTTSTGIDVTGTVTSDGLTVQNDTANFNGTNYTYTGTNYNIYSLHGSGTGIRLGSDSVTGAGVVGGVGANDIDFVTYSGSAWLKRAKIGYNGDISFYNSTGTSQNLFWDASASSLGIGTTSPSRQLHLASSVPAIRLEDTDVAGLYGEVVQLSNGDLSFRADHGNVQASSSMSFSVDGSERARIDSSGNLLVGTTQTFPAFNNVVGCEVGGFGQISASRDGAEAMQLNRKTSDGDIALFKKNGTTVGSIGVFSGYPYIGGSGTTDSFIRFWDASQAAIYPATSTGATNDAAINIGGASQRFKDLYLSGFAYTTYIRGQGDTNTGINLEGSDVLAFQTAGSERIRIDSSGNLLVGKAAANTSVAGAELREHGGIVATRSGSWVGHFNRLSDDGEILKLLKDGTTVGSIGVGLDRIYFSGANEGVYIDDSLNSLSPSTPTGSHNDNHLDLGNSSSRFKDLYLSGGVYLGGTGSSNLLQDYETGSWTPTIKGETTAGTATYLVRWGNYTKVGNLVSVRFYINVNSFTGTGFMRIAGLPFTSGSDSGIHAGSFYPTRVNANITLSSDGFLSIAVVEGSTEAIFVATSVTSPAISSFINCDPSFACQFEGSYFV